MKIREIFTLENRIPFVRDLQPILLWIHKHPAHLVFLVFKGEQDLTDLILWCWGFVDLLQLLSSNLMFQLDHLPVRSFLFVEAQNLENQSRII